MDIYIHTCKVVVTGRENGREKKKRSILPLSLKSRLISPLNFLIFFSSAILGIKPGAYSLIGLFIVASLLY